jgi:non-heme chloroperoxidase
MTHHIQFVTLPGGPRLPYVEHGDPAGVPLILLHGYSDSWRSWELLLPKLPAPVHAYALTQRGHGDADRPAAGYRPEDHAADVAAFMDAVGLDAAIIAGHSGGSYSAQRFALDHPERTLGIVLIGAFRAFHDNPGVLELSHVVSELTDPVDPEFVRAFQESTVAQPLPAGFLEETIVAESRKLPARVWKTYLRDILEADVPTETGTIDAPTLILWGDQDAFCPRSDQDALLAAIPGAQLAVYHGTGHCPHWEQPQRTAADLVAFARRVEPAARAAIAPSA